MRQSAAICAALLLAVPALALEVDDLDPNMPTTLLDAEAGHRGDAEAQFAAQWDRLRGRDQLVRFFPRLQFDPAEELQVTVGLPYAVGRGREADQGQASFGGLYGILPRANGWRPALAVTAEASAPVGPGGRGWEVQLGGAATWPLAEGTRWKPRLHLNALWIRRLRPTPEERPDRMRFNLGASALVAPRTVGIANVLWRTEERRERPSTILEVGLRHQITRGVVLGAALGTGFGPEAPRFRAVLSVQFALGGV